MGCQAEDNWVLCRRQAGVPSPHPCCHPTLSPHLHIVTGCLGVGSVGVDVGQCCGRGSGSSGPARTCSLLAARLQQHAEAGGRLCGCGSCLGSGEGALRRERRLLLLGKLLLPWGIGEACPAHLCAGEQLGAWAFVATREQDRQNSNSAHLVAAVALGRHSNKRGIIAYIAQRPVGGKARLELEWSCGTCDVVRPQQQGTHLRLAGSSLLVPNTFLQLILPFSSAAELPWRLAKRVSIGILAPLPTQPAIPASMRTLKHLHNMLASERCFPDHAGRAGCFEFPL